MTRIITVVIVICATITAFAADTPVKVYVDGELQDYSPEARVREGTTYVPLRSGAESLGFDVKWLAEQNSALICSDTSCVLIPKKDGIIVNDHLLLPLRKMGEALGTDVAWDGDNKAVIMKTPHRGQ